MMNDMLCYGIPVVMAFSIAISLQQSRCDVGAWKVLVSLERIDI